MSQDLGDAVLDIEVDLAGYDRDLGAAERKTAVAAAKMQRLLDLKLDVDMSPLAVAAAEMERRLSGPTVRVGGVVARMERQLDGSIGQMRIMTAEATRLMEHRAATVRMLADAEAAAARKTTAAYAEQAAAARMADTVAQGAARKTERQTVVYNRGGEPAAAPRIYGVRGANAPGSEGDPMTVVIEAANRVGMGSLAAAVGYDSAGGTQTSTPGGTRSAAAMSERDLIRAVGVGERGAQMQTLRDVLAAVAGRASKSRGETAGDRAALGAALAMGNRVQQSSILRQLSREGRGHEVEDILLAGRGGGDGGGGYVGLLGGAAAAGGGDNGRGSNWQRALWGTGLFGLAGMGTVGSFAGLGAEHFLMTGLGIAGSAAGAAAGGGLIALGAAGQMAVGGGSDLAVMKSTLTDTKALETAYDNVGKAVALYGKNSVQAKEAQKELNLLMGELGNTAGVKAELQLAKAADALNEYWDKATSGARVQAVKVLMQGVGLGHTYIPMVAGAAQSNLAIINRDLKPLFRWLEGPEGLGVFTTLEDRFKHNLPSAMGAFDQGVEFLMKTTREASKYTGGFTQALDRFFTKWNSPHYFSVWDHEMGKLVGDFHLWWNLIKVLGRDLYDLFTQDAHTGQSVVLTLTHMLERLGEWERSTKGKGELHNIFVLHREETIALMQALASLVSPFERVYMTLAPEAVPVVTDLAKAVDWLAKGLTSLGPGMDTLLGLALVAAKLGVLKSSLTGVGVALGLVTAKEKVLSDVTLSELVRAQGAATVSAERMAAAETAAADVAPGGLGRLAPSAIVAAPAGARLSGMIESGALGLAGGVEGLGLSGLAGGIAGAGGALAGVAPKILPAALYGGVGYLTASSVANATGLHGTANSALSMAGLGAGIGAVAGPLGMLVGGLTGAGTDLVGKMLFGGAGESKAEEGLKRLNGHIASLGGNLRNLSVKQLQEIHHEAERLGRGTHISKFANELAMLAHETGPVAQAMRAMGTDFGRTAGEAGKSLSDIRGAVSGSLEWIKEQMPRGSAEANSAMAAAFLGGAKDIQVSMKDNVVNVGEGIEAMNKLMDEALAALGVRGGEHASLGQKQELLRLKMQNPEANGGFNSAGGPIEYRAVGGLVQIGNPGEAGHDSVPLNVGGMPVMVAPGEQVAVFNRHQIPIVNTALGMMGYGGLPGLFQDVSTPHYMASGGVIHAPHVNMGGQVGALASAELRTVAAAMNRYVSAHTPRGGGVSTAGLSGSLVAIVHQIARRLGWTSQVGDWLDVINAESGGSMTAKNPTSSAYGIAQFIEGPGAYAKYGGNVNTLAGQLVAMANYIKGRYGDPAAAWAHETAYKWYARGGVVGFAGGGIPVGIANYPQRKTSGRPGKRVSASFGHGAKRNPRPPLRVKLSGHGRPGETLTLPWRNPANATLFKLGKLLETTIPIEQERYEHVSQAQGVEPITTFVSTEGPYGETVPPYIDETNVHARLGQLEALVSMETTIQQQFHRARAIDLHLQQWLAREIAEREHRIAVLERQIRKLREKIKANLKKIRSLGVHLRALEHPKHGKPDKKAIHQVRSEIHALEKENRALGGSPTSIGWGGELRTLQGDQNHVSKQLGTLIARRGTLGEDLKTMQGVGGEGGELGRAGLQLMELHKQWSELQGGSLAAALKRAQVQAGGGSEGASGASAELLALEKQRNENLSKELYASQQQYKVLTNFSMLPPFAGKFHTGGIIPGPVGAERMALVQAGERITPIGDGGDTHVHLHFKPGTEWLRDFVDVRVQKSERRTATNASRSLPSAGGGRW